MLFRGGRCANGRDFAAAFLSLRSFFSFIDSLGLLLADRLSGPYLPSHISLVRVQSRRWPGGTDKSSDRAWP